MQRGLERAGLASGIAVMFLIVVCFGILMCSADRAAAQGQSPAQPASNQYAIDFQVEQCSNRAPTYAALAVSRLGISYCYKDANIARAKNGAVDKCQQMVPRKFRKRAPCEIVSINGAIENPVLFGQLHQEMSIPVAIEVYDGDTQSSQVMTGSLILNGARSSNEHLFSLRAVGGLMLCTGFYKLVRSKVILTSRCFEQYRFADERVDHRGYALSNGSYAPVFGAKFKFNASYIQFEPPKANLE